MPTESVISKFSGAKGPRAVSVRETSFQSRPYGTHSNTPVKSLGTAMVASRRMVPLSE